MLKFVKELKVEIDIPELIEGKSPDDLFEFIKQIDDQHANWDLTVKLYEHFSKLYDEFVAEGMDLKEQ